MSLRNTAGCPASQGDRPDPEFVEKRGPSSRRTSHHRRTTSHGRVICIDELGPIAVKTYAGEEYLSADRRATFEPDYVKRKTHMHSPMLGAAILAVFTVTVGASAMAQEPLRPFSESELFRAAALVMPETDAATFAREIAESGADMFRVGERRLEHPLPRSGFVSVPHSTYTLDTLILLSLVSEEMRVKVERFRAEQRYSSPETAHEREQWKERRHELESIITRNVL
ncbi:MAG: hypothetical protein ACR2GG_08205 [Gemmatimonadaceae bacterium]